MFNGLRNSEYSKYMTKKLNLVLYIEIYENSINIHYLDNYLNQSINQYLFQTITKKDTYIV